MKNSSTQKLVWVEAVKAFALVWIFINHVSEQLFGYPLIANPFSGWPPLSERIAQLAPLSGFGAFVVSQGMPTAVGCAGAG